MTPKEKAKELIRRFKAYSIDDYAAMYNAHTCVDEIIKANPTEYKVIEMMGCESIDIVEESKDYWQQVKEELQKL